MGDVPISLRERLPHEPQVQPAGFLAKCCRCTTYITEQVVADSRQFLRQQLRVLADVLGETARPTTAVKIDDGRKGSGFYRNAKNRLDIVLLDGVDLSQARVVPGRRCYDNSPFGEGSADELMTDRVDCVSGLGALGQGKRWKPQLVAEHFEVPDARLGQKHEQPQGFGDRGPRVAAAAKTQEGVQEISLCLERGGHGALIDRTPFWLRRSTFAPNPLEAWRFQDIDGFVIYCSNPLHPWAHYVNVDREQDANRAATALGELVELRHP